MNFLQLVPNFKTAKKHLQYLSRRKDSREVFQVYRDSEFSSVFPQILIGTLEEHFETLSRLNNLGAAISVVVNETNFKGRTAEDVVRVRAFFTDDDQNLNLPNLFDPPSFEVLSKAGKHRYYVCEGNFLEDFTEIQLELAKIVRGDAKVSDLGRSMRLAGFYHMKDPKNPFYVDIQSQFADELEKAINE